MCKYVGHNAEECVLYFDSRERFGASLAPEKSLAREHTFLEILRFPNLHRELIQC